MAQALALPHIGINVQPRKNFGNPRTLSHVISMLSPDHLLSQAFLLFPSTFLLSPKTRCYLKRYLPLSPGGDFFSGSPTRAIAQPSCTFSPERQAAAPNGKKRKAETHQAAPQRGTKRVAEEHQAAPHTKRRGQCAGGRAPEVHAPKGSYC